MIEVQLTLEDGTILAYDVKELVVATLDEHELVVSAENSCLFIKDAKP